MKDSETVASAHGRESDTPTGRPREETARLGDEIYERDIRLQGEADHRGQFIAIFVD